VGIFAVEPAAPPKDRLRAVMRGTLSHDMLDMHFYGVFRKVELGGNQLVGEAKSERREHMLFAGREVNHRLVGQNPGGAVTFVGSGSFVGAGIWRYRLETWRLNNRQWPVDPTGKNEPQSGHSDLDRDRYRKKAANSPLHRGRSGRFVVAIRHQCHIRTRTTFCDERQTILDRGIRDLLVLHIQRNEADVSPR
jgi:hypothetical protein